MVEEAVAMVAAAAAISVVSAAISLGLRGIVLPAIASHNTKERTLRGTKIISGTRDISFLEIPLGMIIPYYGYYDDNAGDYSDGQSSPAEVTPSQETIIAVQKELTQLGYYHGHVDGVIGRQTAQSPPGCENIR
jgi:hypothetical protein